MNLIYPTVCELVLDPRQNNKWKFTKKMKREFFTKPAGRIWWVNTNTKIKTNINDNCIDTEPTLPPGLNVFEPLATFHVLNCVIDEFRMLYQEEDHCHTLPFYDMAPYNNIRFLFTNENPEEKQMTLLETMELLRNRAPLAAKLVQKFCNCVQKLLGISKSVLKSHSNLGIVKYSPYAGIQTHIDNIVRSGGSAGPVFTMSLGSNGLKHMDMFPVIEHWKIPVRISTPIGSVIMMDGVSRIEWSHGIPEGDPSERWTIMLKFKQITDRRVKFSQILQMNIYESKLNSSTCKSKQGHDQKQPSNKKSE